MKPARNAFDSAIVVFGCDLIKAGEELGPETIKRCKRALQRYQELTRINLKPKLILCAGFGDRASYPNQHHTMAQLMAFWLIDGGVNMKSIDCYFPRSVWGTRAEVVHAIGRIKSDMSAHILACTAVEFVSSGYHLRRIMLLARRVMKYAGMEEDLLLHSWGAKYCNVRHMIREYVLNLPGEFILGLFRTRWYALK